MTPSASRGVEAPALGVALAVEEPDLREAVRSALRRDPGLVLTDPSAGSGPHGADAVVVSCDLASDELEGRLVTATEAGTARAVVVAPHADSSAIRVGLEAGADAVVFHDRLAETLAPAVRAVCTGQICVPGDFATQLRRPVLSFREKQALGMVVLGFSNAEIAAKLYLAESTVKNHLSSAFRTLGVRSRKEAAMLILDPDAGYGPGILTIADSD